MHDPDFHPPDDTSIKSPLDPSGFATGRKPGVVLWHTIFCAFMASIYLIIALAGILAFLSMFFIETDKDFTEADRVACIFSGMFMMAIGVIFGIAFGAAPFLPRRPWAWIYGMVLIVFCLTSCVLWPATIPLLIFWLKPETKRYFGRVAKDAYLTE